MRNWLRISKLAFPGIPRMFTVPGLALELSDLVTDLHVSEILMDFSQDLAEISFFFFKSKWCFQIFHSNIFHSKNVSYFT